MSQTGHAVTVANMPINQPRKISIFGSTGSVGCSTINLVDQCPDQFEVDVLTAHQNVIELAKQARRLNANLAIIADDAKYTDLKDLLSGTGIQVASGAKALEDAARRPVDWVMASIVGAAGLKPALAAVQSGATVALANKESLVCAGELMMQQVRAHGSTLLPVDSEHNAIFQVLELNQIEAVNRLILTASGGPFREFSKEDMRHVTKEQALAHPNWDMGAKISIDSATMMNKGLEFIEAFHLFPVAMDQIEILVHPQSVVHSMVEYGDGSILAQMGSADMRIPISYALGWPDRHQFTSEKLDFAKLGSFTFEDPDFDRFPALKLAMNALETGKSAPAILNAANEEAVAGFLASKIGFLEIIEVVETVLEKADFVELRNIEDVFDQDNHARLLARQVIREKCNP